MIEFTRNHGVLVKPFQLRLPSLFKHVCPFVTSHEPFRVEEHHWVSTPPAFALYTSEKVH